MELKDLDVLIWDIDGVLIYVRDSYRRAIIETVQYYFSELIGLDLKEDLMTIEDTQKFKLVGRFNDDWKLTYTAVLCFLTKLIHELHKSDKLDIKVDFSFENFDNVVKELKKLGTTAKGVKLKLDMDDITERIKRKGGGLEGTKKALKEIFDGDLGIAKKFWFCSLIKRIFQELYLGEKLFKKKYDENAKFVKTNGFIRNEKNLVNKKTLKRLKEKFYMGVATGRERFEAEFVLKRYGFDRFIPLENIVSSSDIEIGKPEPDQLLECRRRICKKYNLNEKETKAAYVGDSVDDVAASKKANFFSVGCLSAVFGNGEKEKLRREFQKLECDLILDNANDLIPLID